MVLLNDDFHNSVQLSLYTVRSNSMNFCDVESFVTCQASDLVLLLVCKVRSVALEWNGITHCIVEYSLKTLYAEGNVQ